MDCRHTVMSIILFTLGIVFSQCNGETTTPKMDPSVYEMVYQSCLDRSGYLPLDNNSFFRVLEVSEHGAIYMPCSFCGESNEESPWYWKWRPRSYNTSEEKEVQLGLSADLVSNRIFMYPNHTLAVQNATANDTGVYYCRSLMGEESKEFQFSVDVVSPEVPIVEEKKMPWIQYEYNHIGTVNKGIYSSDDPVVRGLLEKIHVKVHSEWDPWRPCDGCLRLRKRYAKCRLHISLVSPLTDPEDRLDYRQMYLYHSEHPSCHSIRLAVDLPQLSSLVKQVPNFLRTQTCYDSCPQEKGKSNKGAKYVSDIHLQVGSSMSFICPGADLKSKVMWQKDGIKMKPIKAFKENKRNRLKYFRNPFKSKVNKGNAFVDRFGVLNFCDVVGGDSGSYNCFVNSELVKTFVVTVVVGEHTEIQRYYMYMMLSTYTSVISATVVLLGVAWAFCRRREFPTLEEIEAAERRRNAMRYGVTGREGDSGIPDDTKGSITSTRRFSLIGKRTSKHEHHESVKAPIPIDDAGNRQSRQENHKLSEREPLIS